MANALIQFRMSEKEKQQAALILERIGLNTSVYLRMCMLRLIQENGLPFSMKISKEAKEGLLALWEMGETAKKNGTSEMTLEEINAEIAAARKEKNDMLRGN
jgi:addiction module antitoxin, RelB/DinJ family